MQRDVGSMLDTLERILKDREMMRGSDEHACTTIGTPLSWPIP